MTPDQELALYRLQRAALIYGDEIAAGNVAGCETKHWIELMAAASAYRRAVRDAEGDLFFGESPA